MAKLLVDGADQVWILGNWKEGHHQACQLKKKVTPDQSDLSDKVDRLTTQLETILKWIQAQPSSSSSPGLKNVGDGISPPRARLTTERDKTQDDDNSLLVTEARPQPFKVEAKINIPIFDDTIDAEKLDCWCKYINDADCATCQVIKG
uniref:Uncharacterized protein n=1 Tax=Populus alba TaxID=43335 RepID=A0A4U5QRR7_POPAL|nr:hypothetical protein D5086_0000051560 [Populus alba]